MKIYSYNDLNKQELNSLCSRWIEDDSAVARSVQDIISTVRTVGDSALLAYTKDFDKVDLTTITIEKQELEELAESVPASVKNAIDVAYQNIFKFHQSQVRKEDRIETMPGVSCWREGRAIEKVGLYIPGGSAVLPSTFLMLGIPAKIAGCREIVVCSPPQSNGKINSYIAYVSLLINVEKIYLVGGAQAIAAMAFGTETVPKVEKIFGPGNRYVTEAKKQVQNKVAIDMPAGPSEVLVIADETANPSFVAADLLAQAEHGADSQSILVATSNEVISNVLVELEKQLEILPRKEIAEKAIANSYAICVTSLTDAMAFSNTYAPEHLILAVSNYEPLIPMISNAGSVFLGNLTPESAGDYASGTNHTLPTSGFAKSFSGVSVDTFLKKITFQHLTAEGLQNIGETVETLATAEGLQAHKNAITIRMKS